MHKLVNKLRDGGPSAPKLAGLLGAKGREVVEVLLKRRITGVTGGLSLFNL